MEPQPFPIDVVITWVNGDDPAHAAKREAYRILTGKKPQTAATKARRFTDNGELRLCLRSIRTHAPWVRYVWLITDDQRPDWFDPEIASDHGVHLVNHRQIFAGHEDLLPTFNSLSIETMLWRIDGLAEHFIYFNDDFMLVGPCPRETFFTNDGRPVLRGRWSSASPETKLTFHSTNKVVAAKMMGGSRARFFSPMHVAYPMRRSVLSALGSRFSGQFARNAAYRFRSRRQFWPVALHNEDVIARDGAVIRDADDCVHFAIEFCKTASPQEIRARLDLLRRPEIRQTCLNYVEAILAKCPNALRRVAVLTGPAAPFERDRSGWRQRLAARLRGLP